MHFVLNRASDHGKLRLDDIASGLGSRNIVQIPHVGGAVSDSINEGRPLMVAQPRSPFSRAIATLAERVLAQVASVR